MRGCKANVSASRIAFISCVCRALDIEFAGGVKLDHCLLLLVIIWGIRVLQQGHEALLELH